MKDLDEEHEALKQTVREAHEAIKDLNRLIKEGKDVMEKILAASTFAVNEGMAKAIEAGLGGYQDALMVAIEDAEKGVYRRFDTLASILLGEDKVSKKRGLPSLVEYANQIQVLREAQDAEKRRD